MKINKKILKFFVIGFLLFRDKQMTQTAQFSKNFACSYYSKNEKKYYFAETTTHGWLLGEKSSSLPALALIYPIN